MDLKVKKLQAQIFMSPEAAVVSRVLSDLNRESIKRAGVFVRRIAQREEIKFLAKQAPMIGEGI